MNTSILKTVVLNHPEALLEAAAEGFLAPVQSTPADPFPSPDYLLALRQGGIRDDLIRLAADRGHNGWFDPPLCTFQEIPQWLGATDRRPLGDFERLVLITRILREVGGVFAGRKSERFAEDVSRLFGDLASELVTREQLTGALTVSEGENEFVRSRNEALAAAYGRYLELLEETGSRDGRDTWADCAAAVRADPEALAARLGGRREVRIFGLHDLRRGWRLLLDALVESPAIDSVIVYSAFPIEVDSGASPDATQSDTPSTVPTLVNLLEADSVDLELERVAHEVRQLIDSGTAPDRIAVVSRQARPYTDLAIGALGRAGVPATARQRIKLQDNAVIRAIVALVSAAAEDWTRYHLVELAEQPYFKTDLDPRVLNYVGFRSRVTGLDEWHSQLEKLIATSERFHAETEEAESRRERHRGARPPFPDRARRALEQFDGFRVLGGQLSGHKTLREWVAWLQSFLEDDPLHIEDGIYSVPDERFDVAREDLTVWRGLEGIVREWAAALERWGADDRTVGLAEFRAELLEVLEGDAAIWTTTQFGVRVLEGMAGSYRSFAHVFLVGMDAGRVPVRYPRSALFTEEEWAAVIERGIPLEAPGVWERRERQLFEMLLASGADSLTLSHSKMDSTGREVIPSLFLDELRDDIGMEVLQPLADRVALGLPIAATQEMVEHAAEMASIEASRLAGELTPHSGLIRDPELVEWLASSYDDDHIWSPTRLEAYAKCPWEFFSGRIMKLEKDEDPNADLDAKVRGTILHDALKRFYDDAVRKAGGPVYLRDEDLEEAKETIVKSLDQAIAAAEQNEWLGHLALRSSRRTEMIRYLHKFLAGEVGAHEATFNPRAWKKNRTIRTAPIEHELPIVDGVLERDGVRIRYRGFIDRVEVGVDERCDSERFIAAVDYKTSTYAAPGMGKNEAWSEGVVLQVPLYANALQQMKAGSEVSRVEYWGIKQGTAVHTLELHQFIKKQDAVVAVDEGVAKYERALDAAVGHVVNVRKGVFPADPPATCGCPGWCHARDICRIPGGPRSAMGWGWKK